MGIKERREREKEQRRNDILDAAEQMFFEKGYNATKMDDVAEKAELSKGTLYLYFKNKEELYFGLTHRALLNLRERFRVVLDGDGNGRSGCLLCHVTPFPSARHASLRF